MDFTSSTSARFEKSRFTPASGEIRCHFGESGFVVSITPLCATFAPSPATPTIAANGSTMAATAESTEVAYGPIVEESSDTVASDESWSRMSAARPFANRGPSDESPASAAARPTTDTTSADRATWPSSRASWRRLGVGASVLSCPFGSSATVGS